MKSLLIEVLTWFLVAMKILSMKEHSVQLGECVINVQVKPVQFLVPGYIEVNGLNFWDSILLHDSYVI